MKDKIDLLVQKKYFYEIYAAIIFIISVLSWAIIPSIGISIIMVIVAVMLFFANDIKYALPALINFIFVNGNMFTSNKVPIALIITGGLLVVSIIAYMFRNKQKFEFGKFTKSFIPLAILGIIPIFWSALKDYPSEGYMYLLYFNWVLYYVIYLFIVNTVRNDLIHELAICLSYMGLLIAFECIIQAIRVFPQFDGIFDIYFRLGWGVCNEAGIMMCFALPFVFYLILRENELKLKIINGIKICLFAVGVVLTTSRATYLCFGLEFMLCYIYLCIKSKYCKWLILGLSLVIAIVSVILIVDRKIVSDLMGKVFTLGLTSNGRDLLYKDAISHFTKNPLTVIFGDGIVNQFEIVGANDNTGLVEGSVRMIVYHSTFFQTLASMGILGMLALIFHFVQKYILAFKEKGMLRVFLLISFICLDIYGMIDNTYHMYYYMIILVIVLGIIEKSRKEGNINE